MDQFFAHFHMHLYLSTISLQLAASVERNLLKEDNIVCIPGSVVSEGSGQDGAGGQAEG